MKNGSKFVVVVFVLLLGFASANAFAVWGWMRGAASTHFTDADWDLLKSEARRTLDDVADGTRVDWHNPDSGNGGSIKPLETFTYRDMACHKVALRNVAANGKKGQGVYSLCRQVSGEWKFVADSEIAASRDS